MSAPQVSGEGRACDWITQRRVGGIVSAIVSVALITLAAMTAIGFFGGGNMYFAAAGMAIAAIPAVCLAVYLLMNRNPDGTLGHPDDA